MTAAYLHRRTPSRALGSKTPWKMLHSHIKKKNGDAEPVGPPPIHHLRRFGCLAHKRIPEEQRTDKKLRERSKHAMMVGYVYNSTSIWRIWDPDFKKTIQTSDVDFDEEINCYITCPPPAVSESDGKAIDPFGLPEKEPIHVEYFETADPHALSGMLFSTFFAVQSPACSQFRSPAPAVPATCCSQFSSNHHLLTRSSDHQLQGRSHLQLAFTAQKKLLFHNRLLLSYSDDVTGPRSVLKADEPAPPPPLRATHSHQEASRSKRNSSAMPPQMPPQNLPVTRRVMRSMQLSPQALMTYALNIMMATGSDSDPLTVEEALASSDCEKWKEAMREE
jgi:hypothetical protein